MGLGGRRIDFASWFVRWVVGCSVRWRHQTPIHTPKFNMVAVEKVVQRSAENVPGRFYLNYVSSVNESEFDSRNADVDGLSTKEDEIKNFELMNFDNKVKMKSEGEQ